MISLVLVPDMLSPREGREITRAPWRRGSTVADYLPAAVIRDPAARECVWISRNGGYIAPEKWELEQVRDGDYVACAVRPGDPFTVAFAVVTTIISAWQIYDATRRAKIQGHHAARRAAARAEHMGGSVTYGWGGIVNTVNPGGAIQILYGRRRVGGQYIFGEPTVAGTMDLVLGISEGEVEGLEAGTIEINGRPFSDFSSASSDFRTGTVTQVGYSNLFQTTAPRVVQSFSLTLNPVDTPVLRSTTAGAGNEVDGYEVEVSLPNGILLSPNNAMTPNGQVDMGWRIRHRLLPAGAFVTAGNLKLGLTPVPYGAGGAIQPTLKFRNPTKLTPGRYEIEVTWQSSQDVVIGYGAGAFINRTLPNFTVSDFIALREFREFEGRTPGLATLAITGLPMSAVGGVLPTVTSVWKGRKVADITSVGPPAVFSTEEYDDPAIVGYSRGENVALVLLDIFRTTRYGAGEFIDPDNDLDLQTFIDLRDFCDVLVSRGLDANDPIKSAAGNGASAVGTDDFTVAGETFNDGSVKVDDTLEILTGADAAIYRIGAIDSPTQLSVTTATPPFAPVSFAGAAGANWEIRNTERRCLIDYYFDDVTTIWKALEAGAVPNRIAVVRTNGRIRFVADTNGDLVQLFTQANTDDFKIQYMGKILANRVEVQFPDEGQNWEQSVAQFEDPAALVNRDGVVRTELEAYPVARRSHATRLAKYHWFSNGREPHQVSFVADARSMIVEYGDVIHVQRDEVPRAATPELPGGVVRSVSGLTVLLDDWFTFPSSAGDRFLLQRSDTDATHLLTIPVAFQDIEVDRITFAGFGGYTPQVGDPWIHEIALVDDQSPQLYKVVSISRTEDHRRRVRAVTYDQDVYLDNAITGTTSVDTIELPQNDP